MKAIQKPALTRSFGVLHRRALDGQTRVATVLPHLLRRVQTQRLSRLDLEPARMGSLIYERRLPAK